MVPPVAAETSRVGTPILDRQTAIPPRAAPGSGLTVVLVVWFGAERQGNAAFLGTLTYRLVDAAGKVREEWESPVAVYHPLSRRYVFPVDSLPAGRYTLRMSLTTARSDLDQRNILPAEPVSRSVDVVVP